MSKQENQKFKLFGPDRRYEFWRWRVFFITWLAYIGYYLTRKAFWVAKIELEKPEIMGITKGQMGWIEMSYGIAYALGQFIWGMSADRFGTRKIVLVGMGCSVLVAVAMGLAPSVILLGVLFGLQGLCQSSGWAPLAKNISNFFSTRERGTVVGLWCTNYAIGGLVATIFAGWAGSKWGWPYAFWVPATALFVIWLLFLILQRNKPEDVGLEPIEKYHHEKEAVLENGETPDEEPEGSWKVVGEVIRNRMIVLLGIVYFFLKPTRYAIFAWGPLFLSERLGTNMLESGALSILFEVGGPVSVLFCGAVSDRLFNARRMPISVMFLFILGCLLFLLPNLEANKLSLGLCFFLIGFFLYGPDSLISGTAALDFGTKKGASTAAGFINGCGSIGQIIGLALPGFIYAAWGWTGVFYIMGGFVFIAFILLLPKWNAMPPIPENNNGK